jgi:hypothetical protein
MLIEEGEILDYEPVPNNLNLHYFKVKGKMISRSWVFVCDRQIGMEVYQLARLEADTSTDPLQFIGESYRALCVPAYISGVSHKHHPAVATEPVAKPPASESKASKPEPVAKPQVSESKASKPEPVVPPEPTVVPQNTKEKAMGKQDKTKNSELITKVIEALCTLTNITEEQFSKSTERKHTHIKKVAAYLLRIVYSQDINAVARAVGLARATSVYNNINTIRKLVDDENAETLIILNEVPKLVPVPEEATGGGTEETPVRTRRKCTKKKRNTKTESKSGGDDARSVPAIPSAGGGNGTNTVIMGFLDAVIFVANHIDGLSAEDLAGMFEVTVSDVHCSIGRAVCALKGMDGTVIIKGIAGIRDKILAGQK